MKKALLITLALMLVVSSMVYGSLAVYTVNEEITSGGFTAKTIVLSLDKGGDFDAAVKIAPAEAHEYFFSVSNASGGAVSEVEIDATITVALTAANGKRSIENLAAALYENGQKLCDIPLEGGEGSVELERYFGLEAKTLDFSVVVTWVSSDNDIEFQGAEFGNAVTVRATGVQRTEPYIPEPEDRSRESEEFAQEVMDFLRPDEDGPVYASRRNFRIVYNSSANPRVSYTGDPRIAEGFKELLDDNFLERMSGSDFFIVRIDYVYRVKLTLTVECTLFNEEGQPFHSILTEDFLF